MFRIAIAAEREYTNGGSNGPWYDDQRIQAALMDRGHQVEIIDWEDRRIDPCRFDSIFVSSTWNAWVDPQRYINWLDECEKDNQKRLINDLDVIKAGFVKSRYWKILEQLLESNPDVLGFGSLTPSHFYKNFDSSPDSGEELSNILAELDRDSMWSQANIVIKPTISADGTDTFVYNRFKREIPIDEEKHAQFVLDSTVEANAIFHRLATNVQREGVILQPYMQGVEKGEFSLTILNRKCTHAIQKPGRFRGDNSRERRFIPLDQLPGHMLCFAERMVGLLDDHFGIGSVSRARVDMFVQDDMPVLSELECVEPNTNIGIVAAHNERIANDIVQTYANVIETRTAALNS